MSKRLLYFTPTQAIFICMLGEAPEEIDLLVPLKVRKNYAKNLGQNTDLYCYLNRHVLSPYPDIPIRSWKHQTFLFSLQLREYQSRDLTYDSDALDAFRGILTTSPYRSLWGIPMYHDYYEKPSPQKDKVPEDRLFKPSLGFLHGLLWLTYHETATATTGQRRRNMFPSWSWASARGPVCMPQHAKHLAWEELSRSRRVDVFATSKEEWSLGLRYEASCVAYSAEIIIFWEGRTMTLDYWCRTHKEVILPETSHALQIKSYVFHWRWPSQSTSPLLGRSAAVGALRERIDLEAPPWTFMQNVDDAAIYRASHYIT
ncbi:uncharacterized protein Z518_00775 [Rhinocladiella mackenziei CBS 650.93]|uniref:Heterokaryon incompatibility domain-containing protein n=1 Tax=Rhinocladiella mackenziei CBS 650.93 TaxID=1442369 RepID=A0A0D2IUF2_9EURO|nr:uncharacterized protein Z518_00775 [Rhinocladiella mackenziei CBS 650.93]KIX09694.1 hypothetical protein Z518_00775 [Rhinocladiella mackenziei CBS 650.93]